MQEVMLYCPFCQKQTIKAIHKPYYKSSRLARGSGVNFRVSQAHQEEYIILSESCSNCGKPKKELEKHI